MSRARLAAALVAVTASTLAAAQVTGTFPPVPLASKTFASPADLPYKVDTDVGLIRGVQSGYNICNSTTQNQESLCQTAYFNSFDDFCIWGPIEPDGVVGDIEGEMIAWCSKPGHGTRLIPEGALTGLQWIQTPDYVAAVGFLDQTLVNIKAGDWGGEMDPHGADLRGNPMGGVMFSTAFGGAPVQVIEWHNFIGGNKFCMKACDPSRSDDAHYCEHIFDRIGCDYNIPNNAVDGVFEHCKGDNQDFPGIYTENGEVKTYTQPAESLGAISTMPYQPKVPPHSECVTFSSAAVFTGLPSASKPLSTAAPTTTGTGGAGATGSRAGAAGPSATGTSTRTGSAAGASATDSGAEKVAIPLISAMGVLFAAVFLS